MLTPVTFERFGGLRLDLPANEVGGEEAIYLRDVDWEDSLGLLVPRDGFQKLNSEAAEGEYKGLFAHSTGQLLAIRRVSAESVKIVSILPTGKESKEAAWTKEEGRSCFARFGTPSASYTYARCAGVSGHSVVRYDGSTFTEPKAEVDGEGEKQFPRGAFMVAWPDGDNRLLVANTAAKGGPNEAASSDSHVWFSDAGNAEAWHTKAPEANYIQLSPGDGEEITGMCVWGGQVFIFKETQFFIVYGVGAGEEGEPEFLFRSVQLGQGSRVALTEAEPLAETSDSICVATTDGVYFAATDGVYLTTGGPATKVSRDLRPLEESSTFEGPMADFLNGETEAARWPATGIVALGRRLFPKRHEFIFPFDREALAWLAWKVKSVSMTVWGRSSSGEALAETNSPGTGATSGGEGEPWSNPGNIKASDDAYSTVSLLEGQQTESLLATNHGFEIPEKATIVGVVAKIERSRLNGGVQDVTVSLLDGGEAAGDNKASADAWPEADASKSYGASNDLWGVAWTPAKINSSGFGWLLKAKATSGAPSLNVDHMSITVYYTLPEEGEPVRPRLFISNGKYIYYTAPGAEDDEGGSSPVWQSGFYDFESPNEKHVTLLNAFGEGTVNVAVAKDFGEPGEAKELKFGSEGIAVKQIQRSQQGTLFSHRISGSGSWKLHRLTRFVASERDPGTVS